MYTIKEVSKIMDVSEHTLRFWDKSGFFPFVGRDSNNVRKFSEEDLGWVKIVKCLRAVGVENKAIKRYVELCLVGDSTAPERFEIIKATKLKAKLQLKELKAQLEMLEYKEKFYQDIIDKKIEDSFNPVKNSKSLQHAS